MICKFILCLAFAALASANIKPNGNIDLLKICTGGGMNLSFKENFLKLSRATADDQHLVNELIDRCLQRLNYYIVFDGASSMRLNDRVQQFKWNFFTGEMSLTNGRLHGLQTLSRSGDARFSHTSLELTVPLTFSKLSFDYQYKASLMGYGPSGVIDGTITNLHFTIDLKHSDYRAELKSFTINNKGKISFNFTGYELFDWLLNVLTDVVIKVFDFIFGVDRQKLVLDIVTSIITVYNNNAKLILNIEVPIILIE